MLKYVWIFNTVRYSHSKAGSGAHWSLLCRKPYLPKEGSSTNMKCSHLKRVGRKKEKKQFVWGSLCLPSPPCRLYNCYFYCLPSVFKGPGFILNSTWIYLSIIPLIRNHPSSLYPLSPAHSLHGCLSPSYNESISSYIIFLKRILWSHVK